MTFSQESRFVPGHYSSLRKIHFAGFEGAHLQVRRCGSLIDFGPGEQAEACSPGKNDGSGAGAAKAAPLQERFSPG
jgi:hypothetical protein